MASLDKSGSVVLPDPLPSDRAQPPPLYPLRRELPSRTVVVGDLNGQVGLLRRLLLGLRLIRKDERWCGGRSVLVQMGDIPNRGGGARAAMDLLLRLREEARAAGGDVYWLLGNHEVMSTLRHEAYVWPDEYLEFATAEDIETFQLERTRYVYELLGPPEAVGVVEPVGGRLRAWEEANAPGRALYRALMGADGVYGRAIRSLPIAFTLGPLLFVHGGLSPSWAELGLDELAKRASDAWGARPEFYQELDPQGVFRDPLGPLWHRAYCVGNAKVVRDDLQETLKLLGASQMLVGHTRTDSVPEGSPSVPLVRHRGRLVMTDVGLGEPGEPGCALVIERGRIEMWTPGGSRSKIAAVKRK